jgi:hypothetical protein
MLEAHELCRTISQAELLALSDSPITLLPAPGANRVYVPGPLTAAFSLDGTPYSSGQLIIDVSGADPSNFSAQAIDLTSEPGKVTWMQPATTASDQTDVRDQPLRLRSFDSWNFGPITAYGINQPGVDYSVGDRISGNAGGLFEVTAVDANGGATALVPATDDPTRPFVSTGGDNQSTFNVPGESPGSGLTLDLTVAHGTGNIQLRLFYGIADLN